MTVISNPKKKNNDRAFARLIYELIIPKLYSPNTFIPIKRNMKPEKTLISVSPKIIIEEPQNFIFIDYLQPTIIN